VHVSAAPGQTNASLRLRLHRCIVGEVDAAEPSGGLTVTDSFLRGPGSVIDLAGSAVDIRSSTTIGGVRCATLDASDALLDEGPLEAADALQIAQPQSGCARFSYVPVGAITPRRHRCQPDLALEGTTDPTEQAKIVARLRPAFLGVRAGDPDLGLLSSDAAPELRTMSSSNDEPGVWHHLRPATRLANLRAALRQYLRFGLEAGVLLDR
jgi:hypothetical protein